MATTAKGTGEVGGATVAAESRKPKSPEAAAYQRANELAFAREQVTRLTGKVDKQLAQLADAEAALAAAQAELDALEGAD